MSESTLKPTATRSNPGAFKLSGDLEADKEALGQRTVIKNEKAIARWLQGEYQKCKNQMEPIKRQWYMNLAFFKGDQYVDFVNGRLIKIPAPSSKVRLVINRIKPVVRTEVSRMTSQEPTAEVVPASNEEEDVLAAQAAEAVFASLRESLHLQRVLRQAAWWCSVTGTGYIKTYWDKHYSSEDSNGQAIEGNHCFTSVSPFNVMVSDLLEEDIECQPYVLNVFTKSIEWVKQHYPEVITEDFKPTVVSSNEIMETQYLNTKSSQANSATPDACLVVEAWIKPGSTELFPDGGMALMIDDKIVLAVTDGIPYKHGEYPFAKLDSIQSGSFYATSVVEDLIPIQREINRTRSQMVEARNLMAKPGFFYRSGSIDPQKWTSATAQVIEVKPGAEFPQPIPLPQIPPYVEGMGDRFLQDAEDISGQHQVSKGSAPSGVTAGTAIQFLQEADNSYMAVTHASIEDAIQKVAKHTVALAIQYWDSERLIKYVGRDGTMSARYLQASDLKTGTDIRVEGGSSLPESKAARIALYMDLMTNGALPVQDALELMSLPSMKAYFDVINVDKDQARRENLKMRELNPQETAQAREMASMQAMQQLGPIPPGVDPMANPLMAQVMEQANEPVIPVNDWDNHEVHLMIHETFMKGQEYEMLPDELKNEFELHRQKHKDMAVQSMMEDMMKQGMPPEGMPPEGEPQSPDSGNNQFSDLNKPVDTQSAPV